MIAGSIRLGQALGAGDAARAQLAVWVAFALSGN